jgi:hypothetical protein
MFALAELAFEAERKLRDRARRLARARRVSKSVVRRMREPVTVIASSGVGYSLLRPLRCGGSNHDDRHGNGPSLPRAIRSLDRRA